MRRALGIGLFALALAAVPGGAGPIAPIAPLKLDIAPFTTVLRQVPCEPGRRTVAIASGTGASLIELYVYDEDGNCVAWDDRVTKSFPDDVGAEWFPTRPAVYAVELRNGGGVANKVQLGIR